MTQSLVRLFPSTFCASSRRSILVILSLLMLVCKTLADSATSGSTPAGLSPGAPAGSYALTGFENVNLFNGNLNFHLPLMNVGGRGTAGYTMTLFIEEHWRVIHIPSDPHDCPSLDCDVWYPEANWWGSTAGYGPGRMIGRRTERKIARCDSVPDPQIRYYGETLTRLTFTGPDGTEYEFRDQMTGGRPLDTLNSCNNVEWQNARGTVFVTADGTAATFVSYQPILDIPNQSNVNEEDMIYPSGYIMWRDGARYEINSGRVDWIEDRNGNRVVFDYDTQFNRATRITDSLNRKIDIEYSITDVAPYGLCDRIKYTGAGGLQRTIRISYDSLSNRLRPGSNYTILPVNKLFDLPNATASTLDTTVISNIWLPDDRKYQLYYNPYAEMERVVLPTGGAIEYDFGAGTPGSAAGGVVGAYQIYRRVLERRTYPNGGTGNGYEGRMVYSAASQFDSGLLYYTTIVTIEHRDQAGILASDKHFFYGDASGSLFQSVTDYSGWADGREFKTELFDTGGATKLRKSTETWAQRDSVSWWWQIHPGSSPFSEPPNDPRISDTTIALTDVSPNLIAGRHIDYDPATTFNNVSSETEYDYGAGTLGAPVRSTQYAYVTSTAYTSVPVHLRSLVSQQLVYDAGGTERSRTTYEYDNYNQNTPDAFHATLTNRSNITGLDSAYTATHYTRGNVTRTTRSLLDTSGNVTGSISSYVQYDIAGNVVKSVDPRSTTSNIIASTFDFSDRYGIPDTEAESNIRPPEVPLGFQTYAFPTLVTNPLGHTAYTQYDYYLGRPVNTKDANGIVGALRYDDALERPTGVDVGIFSGSELQRHTSFVYNDSSHSITTQTDQTILNDGVLTSTLVYDGLGRTTETRTSVPEGTIYTTQEYDGLGRVKRSYNPYRTTSEATYGYADTTYDGLGRILTVTTSDIAVVTTTYSGNATTVMDQAGKKRRSVTDGLGRLIRVDEPDSSGNLDNTAVPPQPLQPTSYLYDVLDDLAKVTQGGQTRYFLYDSLKRLIRARNPEQDTNAGFSLTDPLTGNSQWSMKYTYDEISNLLTRIDATGANGITTTYVYDALNRVTSRTYLNDPQSTPAVSYKYDGQSLPTGYPAAFNRGFSTGRLVAVTYGGASAGNFTGYDQLGRVSSSYQQTDSQNYGFTYAYDLAGEMITETYPSGRAITNAYDLAGRLTAVNGQKTGEPNKQYASAFGYAAQGAITSMTLGNNLLEKTTFNNRLQPTFIKLGTAGNPTSVLQLAYTYETQGQHNNNGNVLTQAIAAPGLNVTQSYGYDALNRLLSASENGSPNWSQVYSYDRYGNRWVSQSTGYVPDASLCPRQQTDISAATNRIVMNGFSYDAAGNQKTQTRNQQNETYDYDAENRLAKINNGAIGQYFYDGDGRRVKKIDNAGTTVFVYNAGGQLIAEYHNDPAPPPPGGGGTSYLTSDHLGSTRVVTGTNPAQPVKARYDYLPFGEELGATIGGRTVGMGYGASDSTRQKFTQKERDNESGLDYFLARYYSSAQGRFTSIDPQNAGTTKKDPQTWNAYMYGRNNPLKYVDPDGLKVRVYDENGNYHDLTDEEANNSIFNKKYQRALGNTVKGGNIVDKDGKVIGTYTRISFDDFTPQANEVVFGLAARAKAMNQAIAAFGIGTVAVGATGGAAAYFGGVAIAGSSLTTLEFGEAGVTVAQVEEAAVLEKVVGDTITGYTKHGINQAISRDGVGVSARAILDAVKNPIKTEAGRNAVKYVGEKATVVINQAGKIITAWARSSAGTRIP